MQIVIDIDEDTYGYMQSRCEYQNKGDKGLSKFEEAGVAIKNGIPLPKGHGRLIDADVLKTAFPCGESVRTECVRATIDYAPTIIDADKAESEDKA